MSWNEPALRKDEPGSTDAGIIRTSLYEQVLRQLRQEIVDGILSPNEHHSAISLAQRLGVSRTPVREALLTLERDGLVRIIPNTGVRILTAGLEELVASFELRLLLEIPTVARSLEGADDDDLDAIRAGFIRMEDAARQGNTEEQLRADRDFHSALLAVHANHRIARVLQEERTQVIAGGAATVPRSRSNIELLEEHRPILDAAVRRDGTGAARALRVHILSTAGLLIDRLAGAQGVDPEPFKRRLAETVEI